jgi:hypothetical protein
MFVVAPLVKESIMKILECLDVLVKKAQVEQGEKYSHRTVFINKDILRQAEKLLK